jgi:MoxR-like ATPase
MVLQQSVRAVFASPALYDYLQAIISYTRQSPELVTGLSPRAGLNLLHAARAWALLEGRGHVLPEDLQAVLPSVVRCR